MKDLKILGANIRNLRIAYGETQEQLGAAIFVEKNTVSYYENGKREPNKETLVAIANHYSVSVEELLHSDFTSIGTITVNKDAFWKNIDIVLPIVSSKKALENRNFKKAIIAHRAFFERLRMLNMEGIVNIDVCLEGYLEAFEDDSIKAEAAANFIALWFLLTFSIKTVPAFIKNKPAALRQVATRDEKARELIEDDDSSFEEEAKEVLSDIDDAEIKKIVTEMLTAVKKSKDWSDLADYYLALQYVWNLVDNDLDLGFNQRIGIEMMYAFVTVKNHYAAQFVKFSYDSIKGVGSRSVNDNR